MARKEQGTLTIRGEDTKHLDEIMKLEDLESRPQVIRRLIKIYHKYKKLV